MKNSSLFQTILLIIFGGALLVGVLIFSGILPGFRAKPVGVAGKITLWGTIPTDRISRFVSVLNEEGEGVFVITYVEKDPSKISAELLEALASDSGPDLVLLPQELIFEHRSRLYPVPFSSLTERQYSDTFVDGAKIFRSAEGYLALPVGVDPLVLYYNKDLYVSANIINPPVNWEEFLSNQPRLTLIDESGRITQSATALGTSNNIYNFKNVFSLLSMQAGISPVVFDGVKFTSLLFINEGEGLNPVQLALDFYNQFSSSERSTYSWNRSLPVDRDYFLAGKLANYFGLASEYSNLTAKNPNLNFDVVTVPRLNKNTNLTFGRFYGLAILKKSTKIQASFKAVFSIVFSNKEEQLGDFLGLVPVKRSLISKGDPNPYRQVFLNEALTARAWADPYPDKTNSIFSRMIDKSTSGLLSSSQAINEADKELILILK